MDDQLVLEQLFEELENRRDEVDRVDEVQPGGEVDFEVHGKGILKALWPVPPELCGQSAWWRTPLGRVLAPIGHPDSGYLTIAAACEILEVKPGTIQVSVRRGHLKKKKDPGGGVRLLTSEVLHRLNHDGRSTKP